jgi:hypothetical protein
LIPDARFQRQPKQFWANVRLISEQTGYTENRTKRIRVPSLNEVLEALARSGLSSHHISDSSGNLTPFGSSILAYFQYRADVLNSYVEPRLMDAEEARALFERLRAELTPSHPTPMNKQKGEKKAFAYLTGMVNMLVEAHSNAIPCDLDPRRLTTITRDGTPLRTLARRVDGAFPSTVNPIAIWEIKEYYYTTTFGSRVADGVYESLLDGLELQELREHEGIDVLHYLIVDSHFTWWESGRSYLCRIVDLLHMGYADEVLFGREVVERLPSLVQEWVQIARMRGPMGTDT